MFADENFHVQLWGQEWELDCFYLLNSYLCVYFLKAHSYSERGMLKSQNMILDISHFSIFPAFQFFKKFIYLFILRETETVRTGVGGWRGGCKERGRERESQSGSALSLKSPLWGSDPQTARSRLEPNPSVGRLTNWATQASHQLFNLMQCHLVQKYFWSLCYFGGL